MTNKLLWMVSRMVLLCGSMLIRCSLACSESKQSANHEIRHSNMIPSSQTIFTFFFFKSSKHERPYLRPASPLLWGEHSHAVSLRLWVTALLHIAQLPEKVNKHMLHQPCLLFTLTSFNQIIQDIWRKMNGWLGDECGLLPIMMNKNKTL